MPVLDWIGKKQVVNHDKESIGILGNSFILSLIPYFPKTY
jgi:hypothetical protein